MKTLVLFTLLISLCVSQKTPDQMKAIRKECETSTKVSPAEIPKVEGQDMRNASPEFKCYVDCTLDKTGVFKNGALQQDVALKNPPQFPFVDPKKWPAAVKDCAPDAQKGANKCEKAFSFMSCTIPKIKKSK